MVLAVQDILNYVDSMSALIETDVRPVAREGFLGAVERSLEEILGEHAIRGTLGAPARHLCLAPGAKRARPLLAQVFGALADAPVPMMVEVALAAELIHSGSLLHDDVIDRGDARRGIPTARVVYGDHQAVLAGDLLLSLAISRLAERAPAAVAPAARCLAEMSTAAADEVRLRGAVDVDEAAWRAIAAGKTGALFAFLGRAAGLLAGGDEAEALGRAGEHLGVAFQLADDLADLEGGQGKDRGRDLRERNPNWVVIHALNHDKALRHDIVAAWEDEGTSEARWDALADSLAASAAMAHARAALSAEVDGMERALHDLDDRSGASLLVAFGRALRRDGLAGAGLALEAAGRFATTEGRR